MDYTPEQHKMLERFEKGLNVEGLQGEDLEIFWFLNSQGLLQPRADIEDGLHFLSEKGKISICQYRDVLSKAEKEASNASKKESKNKKEKISDRLFQIFLVVLGYMLGLLTDNLPAVIRFFQKIPAWLSTLFQ